MLNVKNCDKGKLRVHKTCKKEARILKSILIACDTQKYDLANYLNMSDRTIRYWFEGFRLPNPTTHNSIEYYFNMRFDELFHDANFYEPKLLNRAIQNCNKPIFKINPRRVSKSRYKIFYGLVVFHKVNITFISEHFGIPYHRLKPSFYGQKKLSLSDKTRLSEIFNVPIEILFNEEVTTRREEMIKGTYSRRKKFNEQLEISYGSFYDDYRKVKSH